MLIFTFAKFPPPTERLAACKSQRAFPPTSANEILPLRLLPVHPVPGASAPSPAARPPRRGHPCLTAPPDITQQRLCGAGASRQAGRQAGPCPLRMHNLCFPSRRPGSGRRFPPLPHTPHCNRPRSRQPSAPCPPRSSARPCPATFAVPSPPLFFWPCLS